ncbi:MAG: acyl-CoA desaturase [Nevskiaceae bacterium]|nr:MAG: acyl-CoA desaturase [Nevskiaceae bacterium]
MNDTSKAPINWPATLMLLLTSLPVILILPFYLWQRDVSAAAWIWALVFLGLNELSITAGYHRLWSHRAYKAQPALKWFYAVFGGMAVQNSILIWATAHRVHHAHVDDVDLDPYSAKRGFWFSHLGWMLRDYPASKPDFSRSPDLLEDKVVMFQHRHYLWFAFGSNFGLVMLLGALYGDMAGFVLVAGFLRLFVSHHLTFFINSLAHCWGRQPYTTTNTARDNDLLAVLTWGEGYHNYHHLFQWDYRNGIRWWQFDPTKWWIAAWARVGLASGLRRVPEFKIQQARVQCQLERARAAMEGRSAHARYVELKAQIDAEWQHLTEAGARWAHLQSEKLTAAKEQIRSRWEQSEFKHRMELKALELSVRLQHRRVALLLRRQIAMA